MKRLVSTFVVCIVVLCSQAQVSADWVQITDANEHFISAEVQLAKGSQQTAEEVAATFASNQHVEDVKCGENTIHLQLHPTTNFNELQQFAEANALPLDWSGYASTDQQVEEERLFSALLVQISDNIATYLIEVPAQADASGRNWDEKKMKEKEEVLVAQYTNSNLVELQVKDVLKQHEVEALVRYAVAQ